MFARKTKKNYAILFWAAAVLCLCVLIIYFAWPEDPAYPSKQDDAQKISQNEKDMTVVNKYLQEGDGADYDYEDENEDDGIIPHQTPYYLVKRAGDAIVVFFCDENGNMVQLERTEILYEMLGPDDQELFDQGVQIESQEELSTLLQDFEG